MQVNVTLTLELCLTQYVPHGLSEACFQDLWLRPDYISYGPISYSGREFNEKLLPAPGVYTLHAIKLCKAATQLIFSRDALIAA